MDPIQIHSSTTHRGLVSCSFSLPLEMQKLAEQDNPF